MTRSCIKGVRERERPFGTDSGSTTPSQPASRECGGKFTPPTADQAPCVTGQRPGAAPDAASRFPFRMRRFSACRLPPATSPLLVHRAAG
jgi:hypothetical protein